MTAENAPDVRPGDLIRFEGMFPEQPSYRVTAVNGEVVTFTWAYAFGLTGTVNRAKLTKVTHP